MNIKRQLKKEADFVPDIRENLKEELGLNKKPQKTKIKWQFILAPIMTVVVLAIVLSVVLVPNIGDKSSTVPTQMQIGSGKSVVVALSVLNGLNQEASAAADESEKKALVEQVDGYVKSLEKYLDSSFTITLDGGNKLKIVNGQNTYNFEFKRNKSGGGIEEMQGTLKVGEKSYYAETYAQTVKSLSKVETTYKAKIYFGDKKGDSYVKLSYEVEEEVDEKEVTLSYSVYENGILTETAVIETEIEAAEKSADIEITKGGKKYQYSYEIENDEAELEVKIDGVKTVDCKLIFTENGTKYKFDDCEFDFDD